MADITLWGFSKSTYVRTVLAEKRVGDYAHVEVDVAAPRGAGHPPRHPFGKIPVIEHAGLRIYETAAICRDLDRVLPARSVLPHDPAGAARAEMAIGIVDGCGYRALVHGVAAYHLFAAAAGGRDETRRRDGLAVGQLVLAEVMRLRGGDAFIAGPQHGVADDFLGPVMAAVAPTADGDEPFTIDGVADWRARLDAVESFRQTRPPR